MYAEMVGDYLAVIGLGIVFQYFAIAPMRGLTLRKGLAEAAKADVLSLTAFEIGLFGWMALTEGSDVGGGVAGRPAMSGEHEANSEIAPPPLGTE